MHPLDEGPELLVESSAPATGELYPDEALAREEQQLAAAAMDLRDDEPAALHLQFVLKTQKCKDADCGEVHPMLVRVPMTRDEHAMYRDQHPCCWYPALDDEDTFVKALEMDAEQLVSPCQRHQHTFTCYKYYYQMRLRDPGLRKACRFKFGRKLVVTSHITEEGAIMLRRLSHLLIITIATCCRR